MIMIVPYIAIAVFVFVAFVRHDTNPARPNPSDPFDSALLGLVFGLCWPLVGFVAGICTLGSLIAHRSPS